MNIVRLILTSLFIMANVTISSAQQKNEQLDSLETRVKNLESQVYFMNSQITNILDILKEMSDIIHNNGTSNVTGLKLFDAPGRRIEAKTLKIFQIIGDGALAMVNDIGQEISSSTFGTVLYLKNKPGESYYDDQIIKIPSRKVLRQIGTYTYITKKEIEKTVPIVEIFNK